jgi:hypothetical protein
MPDQISGFVQIAIHFPVSGDNVFSHGSDLSAKYKIGQLGAGNGLDEFSRML